MGEGKILRLSHSKQTRIYFFRRFPNYTSKFLPTHFFELQEACRFG